MPHRLPFQLPPLPILLLFTLALLCLLPVYDSLAQPELSPEARKPVADIAATEFHIASDAPIDSQFVDLDGFGTALSLSGDFLLVGAPVRENDDGSTGRGFIYQRSGESWTKAAELFADDPASNTQLGQSVALDGDYALLGAHDLAISSEESGAAYVFKRSGSTWTKRFKLTPTGGQPGERFGAAVALSGSYAVIGAPESDAQGSSAGRAYIFMRSGEAWTQVETLLPESLDNFDRFGTAVAMEGDLALVGAPGASTDSFGTGAVFVYTRSGAAWELTATLAGSDSAFDHEFGVSVDLDGNRAIIGATGADGGGAVYIFVRSGDAWLQTAKLTASDREINDAFGSAVALRGVYAVVGAEHEDTQADGAGASYVFSDADGSWSELTKLVPSDPAEAERSRFGTAVSLGQEYMAVGYSEGLIHLSANGAVSIFTHDDGELPDFASVNLSGSVSYETDTPVTAMVLANGQFTFSGGGTYALPNVPLDGEGQVTVQIYAAGLAPKVQVLAPTTQSLTYDIPMTLDEAGRAFDVTHAAAADESGRYTVSGTIAYAGIPVCALALANGQHAFSCGGGGAFTLTGVPLDGDGRITLQTFASGFSPGLVTFAP